MYIMMDKEILKKIENRLRNATTGPWKVFSNEEGVMIGTAYNHPQLHAPSPVVTIATHAKEPVKRIYISEADATFISHAYEDMELLLEQAKYWRSVAECAGCDVLRSWEMKQRRYQAHAEKP